MKHKYKIATNIKSLDKTLFLRHFLNRSCWKRKMCIPKLGDEHIFYDTSIER